MNGERHGVVMGHDVSHDEGHGEGHDDHESHGEGHDEGHGEECEGVLHTLRHPCKALLRHDHKFPNIH